jgi:formylglycine-generating enzyme
MSASSQRDRIEGGTPPLQELAWVPSATLRMGSNDHYPEEAPVHAVAVDGFWIDRLQVTNSEFAAFVDETGYVTVAERALDPADFPGAPAENLVPGSLVFTMTSGPVDLRNLSHWWTWTPGACWRYPEGPGSSLAGRQDHPATHVAYEDAEAYAAWAGKSLPTEAEWELAARGGLKGATFVWGGEPEPPGEPRANYWHGDFPWRPDPGYGTTTPVGSFPPNGSGLFDMAGNVWEWTTDFYRSAHPEAPMHACCGPSGPRVNPRVDTPDGSYNVGQPGEQFPRMVVKGGSHLCAPNYCLRYRPAARQPQSVETSMAHLGFRCIVRA